MALKNFLSVLLNREVSTLTRVEDKDRKEFYESRIFPQDISGLNPIYNSFNATIPSIGPIRFQNHEFGADENEFIKSVGKSSYLSSKTVAKFKYHRLLYKDKIFGRGIISQAHFLDEKLIYGCHSFSDLNKSQILDLKCKMIEKYANTSYAFSDYNSEVVIKDNKLNKIVILEDVKVRICFITGDILSQEILKTFIH